MPYGRQQDGTVAIGSLELLQSSQLLTLFNTNDPTLRTGSVGEETAAQINIDIPDQSFDLVIMNPPFTSDTKHRDADDGVLNAAFAAYNSSEADQDGMANRLKAIAKKSAYHGHAGLASAFASLGHRKLRPGGVIALVLPFTAVNGASWAKFRELIATDYTDVAIVSIVANGDDMSFSSDTGIAECLVIARKRRTSEQKAQRALFSSLRRRPQGFAHASALARKAVDSDSVRSIEEGPYGGASLSIGDELAGELLYAPITDYENGWGAARILDASVAQVAHSLSIGELWLPAEPQARELSIAQLDQVGQRGLDSQMFISAAHNGPFSKVTPSPTATYPCLWNHDAKNETRIICAPDSQLLVRQGMEARAAVVWATASRTHLNRDFRFNSQPLTAAFTEQKCVGGVAWPNVAFADNRFDYAFTLWCNSTLGTLLYWWHSNRQQSGRGRTTIHSAETLPVLDCRALSEEQLLMAEMIFNEFRDKEAPARLPRRRRPQPGAAGPPRSL